MNKKEIEELIKFVSKLDINEVSLEDKDFKLTIIKNNGVIVSNANQPSIAPHAIHAPIAAPAVAPPVAPPAVPAAAEKPSEESAYSSIKSPMIGTFYRASSPEKPNFVNVGDKIEKGQVICIIEAMKLFNEIESEVTGKVVKVLVDNSTPIEYDQPLFLIDPNG